MPICWVLAVTCTSTFVVPLRNQSLDGSQTGYTGQVNTGQVGFGQVGFGQVGIGQDGTEQGRFLSVSTPFWAGFAPDLVGFGRYLRGFDVFSG